MDSARSPGGEALVRFLHSGDWQLGMTRRALGEDAQARFTEARFEAIRRLGALAAEQACAFVVVCGDVFESNQVDRRTVARACEALGDVPVPVHLLPGNHDPLDGGSVFRSEAFRSRAPDHVHVLGDGVPTPVAPGVELVGAPWTTKRPGRDLVAETLGGLPPPRGLRILAAHGAVDGFGPEREDPAAIVLTALEAAITAGHVHYVALGDRHSSTRIGRSGRVWYAGAPEPTDYDEVDPGNVLVVDLDEDGANVVPHAVGTWRFLRRGEIPVDGDADLDALIGWLDAQPDKARTLLRLGFRGTLDLRGAGRLETLLEDARDVFAAVDDWPSATDLAVLPADADFEDLALSGFAERAVAKLRDEAADPHANPVARDALALLVRLAGSPPS